MKSKLNLRNVKKVETADLLKLEGKETRKNWLDQRSGSRLDGE